MKKLVIAATQSGAGKTTIVTGIISALVKRGMKVQAYKIGPDYIDPGYHSLAANRPAHNLDTWLVGEDKLEEIFLNTSSDCDIAIIEGVMGLYDGGKGGISSTAEVAKILNAPVILVIDVKSMGTSAAAIALGFKEFDKEVNLAGVILNRIGSLTHKQMIEESLKQINIECLGAIKRDEKLITPERHLGLLPSVENDSLLIDNIRVAIEEQIDIDRLIGIAKPMEINQTKVINHLKTEVKIAVASDEAFNFYYEESLRILEELGAEVIKFSPLHDKELPKVNGLIIGGGFPEIFANELEKNQSMRNSIKQSIKNGLPTYAECGGYMYLMNELIDFNGKSFDMVGVIDNSAQMNNKLQTVGYVEAKLKGDCILGLKDQTFHAHEFHFSSEVNNLSSKAYECVKIRNNLKYDAGFVNENVVASYLHIHFAGCIDIARKFVESCKRF